MQNLDLVVNKTAAVLLVQSLDHTVALFASLYSSILDSK